MKRLKEDKSQSTLFDFDEEEKLAVIQTSQNRIPDFRINTSDMSIPMSISGAEEEENGEDINLRSEQIIISKESYPSMTDKNSALASIDSISRCSHKSKNLFNQSLFQIRQAFFGKINDCKDEEEKELRIKIRSALNKFKENGFNYKNAVYKLLDKYFRNRSNNRKNRNDNYDNYSWSAQAAQQAINLAVEAWYDNDLARADYEKHPADYTGKPNIPKYRKGSEYIVIFTNQQCKIETKDIFVPESIQSERIRYVKKNFVTFPDHLRIKPIGARLSDKTDLREVRIVPQIKKGCYKVELVYKKVIDKEKIRELNLDLGRIIGIDPNQGNIVAIANNIGKPPIIIKGGILLAINQWFDKMGSKLYSIYYRQQRQEESQSQKEGKTVEGKTVLMGAKMRNLSFNRKNLVLDILHKISRFIVNYCVNNRIGTIVWGRNPGWKQEINIGRRNNQKFTKIPHYLLFKMLKYKSEENGIRVIDVEESWTSKCSFLDQEPIGHKEKYVGRRIKRGLFRSALGIIINADVNAAYNIIRKVFPEAFRAIGIEGVVLHPERLSIKDLLSNRPAIVNLR